MNKWENEKCVGCGQGFTKDEWIDAHTAHDKGCPIFQGKTDLCRCTRQYHARCCPDCNGTKLAKAREHFAAMSTEEMIQHFIEALEYLAVFAITASVREFIPDDPSYPSLEEEQKDYTVAKAVVELIGDLLIDRGIDPSRFMGGE